MDNLLASVNKLSIGYRHIPSAQVVVLPKFNESSFLKNHPAVEAVHEIETSYQLASKTWKQQTHIDVKGVPVGKGLFNVMAGPCSVETEEQIFKTAEFLSKSGVKFIRGGAYKPRTSPYSFRGLGKEGLKLMRQAADRYDLRVVTEILDLSLLDEVMEYADILQVGSRNMHNFHLLNELGKVDKPVLLKRGMQAKATEWLLAAEYVLSGGNGNVILCERGIRSFDPATRNVMDIGIIPLMKSLSHLPVIADPSHGTGASSRVLPLTLASAAAGADGVLIEVHPNPEKALSDSEQAVSFEQFDQILAQTKLVLQALGRHTDTEAPVLKLQSL